MKKLNFTTWLLLASAGFALTGCGGGDAETTIIEKDPIVEDGDDHDHDHDHGDEHTGEGRLVVLNATMPEAAVFNLEDNSLLDAFALSSTPSALSASAGYRYGILVDRSGDSVGFLDGGLWQEDHVDHLHDYEEAPTLLSYTLDGSRPTHIVPHEQQLAVFFDGNAETETPASTVIVTDEDIAAETLTPATIDFGINMHGVAEPRGEHVFASWRRADEETTSANPILPDQIAMYHLHDSEYEQEVIFEVVCPDLHGAAQNEDYIAFGCSDGVVVIHEHEGEYEAEKILNPEGLEEGLRIGAIYGHEESEQFIALASAHGGASAQWVSIDPSHAEIELIDWQPMEGAQIVARGFAFEAEQFLILDSLGYLTALEAHAHDDHVHWDYGTRLRVTEGEPGAFPEGTNFSMTVSQNAHLAYVADPAAQHVLIVDLELMEIDGDIELGFVPSALTWLGIAHAHED